MSTQKISKSTVDQKPPNVNRPRYTRIVVKVGTALLTHRSNRLNIQTLASLVEQIAHLHLKGYEMLLVTSGAVAAGHHVLGIDSTKKNVPLRQVLAAAGQGRLMHVYEQLFDWHGIPVAQALLTRRDLSDRVGYLNIRNTLMSLLNLKVIPIINENDVVAVEELDSDGFGDNDNLSAMVANFVDADMLIMLGEIDGLYTSDPHKDSAARLIPRVERMTESIEALGGVSWDEKGRGGMATKLEAARLATASGVNVVIAGGRTPDVITLLAKGDDIGTTFPACSTKMESRKRWMLSGLSNKGEINVDDGAARALIDNNRSLLPAGIKEVRGNFSRGDIITIIATEGNEIAAGISNYNSVDLAKIAGTKSDLISELLGHDYGEEAIHRNNMVLL
ncbi:MAG: glutamate 5-kinase [SAR202 cluster bacterium]|jgi:glutamate 5-kinase|nr:glutamate 5-kinase [SAR202 cluster bacterium]